MTPSVTTSPNNKTSRILQAAGLITVFFLIGNVLGLLSEVLIARQFGASADPYFAAFSIPDLLFNIIAGGALGSSFLPVFAGLLAQGKTSAAWRLASNVINLVFCAVSLAAVGAFFAAPWLLRQFVVPGWADQPAQLAQTVSLMRIMLLSTLLFSISGLVMAIHNAQQHFFTPALAPITFNSGIILGTVLLAPHFGLAGVAWGVVLGAACHLGLQLPPLFGYKGQYHWEFGLDNPAVRQIGWLMLPRMVGLAVWEINFWVNKNIASHLQTGSITALEIGFKIANVPQIVIARALAMAVFPTFAAQAAVQNRNGMRNTLIDLLRMISVLALPATIGLILLGERILALLFESDHFTSQQTQMVYWALVWYTSGLLAHSVVEVITRAYYALHDTRTPLFISITTMLSNVLLSLGLSQLFQFFDWLPHGGIALANTLATTIEAALLLFWLRKHLENQLALQGWFNSLWRVSLASLGMGAIVWFFIQRVHLPDLWLCASAGALGALTFGAFALLLGVPEAKQLISRLPLQRFRR
jgi:putative peptidoglycan lipid II flippase